MARFTGRTPLSAQGPASFIRVDLTRYRRAVVQLRRRLSRDTFDAVNLAAQATLELLRQFTPRVTGQTVRSLRVKKTSDYNLAALAGFWPGKGNTAFVARLLEHGRSAAPARAGGSKNVTVRRIKDGKLRGRITGPTDVATYETTHSIRLVKKRATSRMAPRPILAKVLPLVPATIRESFKTVFGPDWNPKKQ